MHKNYVLTALIFTLYTFYTSYAQNYYVTPYRAQNTSNTGLISDPYDNLLLALNAARNYDSANIYLFYGGGTAHYVFLTEQDPTQNDTYLDLRSHIGNVQRNGNYVMDVKTVTIRPYYCYESYYPYNTSQHCAPTGQRLYLYLKTTQISFLIKGGFTLQNVILSAIDDIRLWNADTNYTRDCLYTRKTCCSEGQTYNSNYNVYCGPTINTDYSGLSIGPSIGLFVYDSPIVNVTRPSMDLNNVAIKNFVSPHLTSFIQTTSYSFALTIASSTIDNMFFDRGLIYHDSNSAAFNSSSINIQGTTFSNYNNWNLRKPAASRSEGYLFYTANTYSGVISLLGSNFTTMTTSVRSQCWAQSTANYNAPMNNRLTTEPRSRSDIWNQYHKDHLNRPLMSSLVYIKTLTGSVSITNSNFRDIIGTSGSVLRVDEAASSNVWFTVYNSNFDGNFAYDGFANILIAQSSRSQFTRMLACPHVEVVGSTFVNSYGCPGSYGNLAMICYWDSAPPQNTDLSSYTVDTSARSDYNDPWDGNNYLSDFWVQQNERYSYIRVKNTRFENNQLAISNSLAIVGSYWTLLELNTFKGNGGTTRDISSIRLTGSNFLARHPGQVPADYTTHFGQSTAVYFDRVVKLTSRNNTFDGNWGPWEGSLALASSLTIKNWIRIKDSIKSQNDMFINHQGVPTSISSTIAPNDKVYSSPILAISYDYKGSDSVYRMSNSLGNVTSIAMNNVKFDNNLASYDYTSFTYNTAQLSNIVNTILKRQLRYTTGFIKLLLNFEAADLPSSAFTLDSPVTGSKFSFSLIKSQITNNKLLSTGCLFPTLWAETYFLYRVNITNNDIFSTASPIPQSSSLTMPSLSQALHLRHGLFCLSSQESLEPTSSVTLFASNIKVDNNKGVVFNIYPESSATLHITGSVFSTNTNAYSSMISVYDSGSLVSTNNVFTTNTNALGNVFATNEAQVTSLLNTQLKNSGTHASLFFLNNINTKKSYEISGKVYWNTVSPQYKLFLNNLSPQAGLYFQSSSWLEISLTTYKENTAYSGIITSFESTTKLTSTTIQDHVIIGTSVIGNFLFLSKISMLNTKILNCSISSDPLIPIPQSAVIMLFTADLQAQNVQIIGGTSGAGTMLIFGSSSKSSFTDVTLSNFYRLEGTQTALIHLVSSNFNMLRVTCTNTTSLFNMMSTTLNLDTVTITNMKATSGSQFLVSMSGSTFKATKLTYNSNSDLGDLLPFIGGDSSYVIMTYITMLDLPSTKAKVFELQNSKQLLVTQSIFGYQALSLTTVFDLASHYDVSITKCTFKNAGQVIAATEARGTLYFISNTIFSGAEMETIKLTKSKDSLIYDNSFMNSNDGASTALKQSKFKVTNSLGRTKSFKNIFFSLYGLKGIFEVTAETSPYDISSKSDLFVNNQASAGGVLYLYVSKLWSEETYPSAALDGSVFISNKAVTTRENYGRGGAIFQTSPGQIRQTLTIDNSYFIRNTAQRIGGAIYFDYSPPNVNSASVFQENYAVRLNHIASYPVRVVQLDLDNPSNITYVPNTRAPSFAPQTDPYIWANVPSGPTSSSVYIFALLDMHSQVMYDDDLSVLQLYPNGFDSSSRELFSKKITLKAQDGLYVYDKFQFTYRVGENISLIFTSTAIAPFSELPIDDLVMDPTTQVQADFRMCQLGEFVVVDSNSLSVCQACEATFWQLTPGSAEPSCQACDTVRTYCLGGNNVGPRAGYWRMNSTSDVVLECPIPEACKGNSVPGDAVGFVLNPVGECEEEYEGNVCDSCVFGYAKNGDGECKSCSNNVWRYIQFVLFIALQVYVVGKEVKEVMELTETYRSNDVVKTDLAILIRILMNYFQLISVAGGFGITWPDAVGDVLVINAKIASFTNEVLAIDCFLTTDKYKHVMVFIKVLGIAVGPFIFVLLGAIFWFLYFLIRRKPIFNNKEFMYNVVTTAVIICFNMQPIAITKAFSLFQCANLYRDDSPMYFLTSDYDVPCWDGAHKYWLLGLGLPALFVWVLALPLIMLFLLRRNKNKLTADKIAKKYSFMYLGYKSSHYYWEFVIMARKILLIFGAVIATLHSIDFQIYFTVILTIWAYLLHTRHQPYTEKELNKLEAISLISSEIVNFSGLYFQLIKRSLALDISVMVITLIGTAYFFLQFLRLFFKARIQELARNEHVVKIVRWINRRLCCCIKTQSLWEKMGIIALVNVPMHLAALQKQNLNNNNISIATETIGDTERKGTEPILITSPTNQTDLLLTQRLTSPTERGLLREFSVENESTPQKAKPQQKSMFSNLEFVQKSKNIVFPKKVVLEDSEKGESEPEDLNEATERLETEDFAGYNIRRPNMTPQAKFTVNDKRDSDGKSKFEKQ